MTPAAPAARAALLWQALLVAALLGAALWLLDNTLANMAKRGIASGFGFLGGSAGFGISMSLISYDETASVGRAFLVGLLNTLLVSAIAIVIATVIGFAVGISRLSSNWLLARIAGAYVETLRNIPLLLQIFFWYFAVLRALPAPQQSFSMPGGVFLNNRGLYLPSAEFGLASGLLLLAMIGLAVAAIALVRRKQAGAGVLSGLLAVAALGGCLALLDWTAPALRGFNYQGGVVLIPEFVALVVALSTYTAAFIAEVVRAGLQSVPRGQVEAARALGLGAGHVLRLVVVPQALRVIVPPLTNQYLNLTKNSSLAAAIAYPDLVSVFAGTVLNITGQAVEVIVITMAVYLFISLTIALAMNVFNRAVVLRGSAA